MKSKQKRAWMTPSEVSLFCQQVELLLQSGIPLYEGCVPWRTTINPPPTGKP